MLYSKRPDKGNGDKLHTPAIYDSEDKTLESLVVPVSQRATIDFPPDHKLATPNTGKAFGGVQL